MTKGLIRLKNLCYLMSLPLLVATLLTNNGALGIMTIATVAIAASLSWIRLIFLIKDKRGGKPVAVGAKLHQVNVAKPSHLDP